MQSLTTGRRRSLDRRRKQIRRRRAVALVTVVTLVLLAVWLAYSVPTATPARVPQAAAEPTFAGKPAVDSRVIVATVETVEVLMPVALDATTAIGYHPVDNANTVPFSPQGELVSGGSLTEKLADVFKGGGELKYYLMSSDASDRSSSTSGLDVGAMPGSDVVSPIDGKVVSVRETEILGRYDDVEIGIQASDDPSVVITVSHVVSPTVKPGDSVRKGETFLGQVRAFPSGLQQELSKYTSDAGDHVQLMAVRVQPDIAGL